jgi:hypothetical protein
VSADPLILDRPRPRNRRAYEAAQELHGAVRSIVADLICPSCHRPPRAKLVKAKLPPHLQRDDRTINAHIRDVMKERGAK